MELQFSPGICPVHFLGLLVFAIHSNQNLNKFWSGCKRSICTWCKAHRSLPWLDGPDLRWEGTWSSLFILLPVYPGGRFPQGAGGMGRGRAATRTGWAWGTLAPPCPESALPLPPTLRLSGALLTVIIRTEGTSVCAGLFQGSQ